MTRILNKRMWLAGPSLLAIILGSGDANAVVFSGGDNSYVIPSAGWYDFTVTGAAGGGPGDNLAGGSGAVVGGELFLGAGNALDIVVGAAGGQAGCYNGCGAGGGGGSFVFRGGAGSLLFAAGGGAGAPWESATGNPGVGYGGHPGGVASYGGGGGGQHLARVQSRFITGSRRRADLFPTAAMVLWVWRVWGHQAATAAAVAAATVAEGAAAALPVAQPARAATRM